MNLKRVRKLNKAEEKGFDGPVFYWMSRDQRVKDNWAFIYAQKLAFENKQPLAVVFCLAPKFLGAAIRQYRFMLDGLKQAEKDLKKKNINFYILIGEPQIEIAKFIKKNKASVLVSDFDPLKIKRKWKDKISKRIKIPFLEVDAHNIVPCWLASDKQEYAAYTIRPKINKFLPEFLENFPYVKKQKKSFFKKNKINWKKLDKFLKADKKIKEIGWLKLGEKQAKRKLNYFIKNKLKNYSEDRNNPTKDALSNLSPYLHFGQISAQRVAFKVKKTKFIKQKSEFLEELIVRKEFSDNFCFYNKNYDSFKSFPDWAKKTLKKHKDDKREYIYSLKEFEQAKTHDDLWNAAQMEMVSRGKMHSYMRMYWAKKILQWSESPEKALKTAIYLNDKYELDGRDPNGYTGIAWSIGGVHDRAWKERPVFGKIRYMSYNGAKSKFDVKAYISEKLKK